MFKQKNDDKSRNNKVSFGTDAIEIMKKMQEQNERIREKIKRRRLTIRQEYENDPYTEFVHSERNSQEEM